MMELRLAVRTEGDAAPERGSLGWLLTNAGHVEITRDKHGDPYAKLMDRAGKLVTLLAGRNMHADDVQGSPAGEYRPATAYNDGEDYDANGWMTADMEFSASAWDVIRKIQKEAIKALEEYAAECDGVSADDVDVILVRVRDRDAGAMAAAAAREPSLVPILKDRLSEAAP
jgi:hypothetical protein